MHERLRSWHCQNFGELEKHLKFYKKIILFFDEIEERRVLSRSEFLFRNKVRERAYMLATVIETRWHQRSRSKWLASGDKNTRFFHAIASSRQRRNAVTSLKHEGALLDQEDQIKGAFLSHMKGLLGTEQEVLKFNPSNLYEENQNLSALEAPFTVIEIEVAVRQLARNKVSGPDGLPNEFVQYHWMTVKEELVDIVQRFYENEVDLREVNRANIIMVPKKEVPEKLTDYRPISVMNVIPKVISKILANWLREVHT